MRITKRAFRDAVDAAVEARRLAEPVRLRQIAIDFEGRTVTIDGRRIEVTAPGFVMPILNTERVILIDGQYR